MLIRAVPVLLLALLAFASACGGDSAGSDATASPGPTDIPNPTPTAVAAGPTATPAPSIRDTDLSLQPGIMEFQRTAGDVQLTRIRFIDLTFDGREEAMVVFSSGGTGGDVAAFLLGYGATGIEELLRIVPDSGQLTIEVLGGNIFAIEPRYSEGDPFCCPSENFTTVYRWDGHAFAITDEIVAPARR